MNKKQMDKRAQMIETARQTFINSVAKSLKKNWNDSDHMFVIETIIDKDFGADLMDEIDQKLVDMGILTD